MADLDLLNKARAKKAEMGTPSVIPYAQPTQQTQQNLPYGNFAVDLLKAQAPLRQEPAKSMDDALPAPVPIKDTDSPYDKDGVQVPGKAPDYSKYTKQKPKTATPEVHNDINDTTIGGKEDQPKQNYIPFTEKYEVPVKSTEDKEFKPESSDWFGNTASEAVAPQTPLVDPHRSLLQAIMGWDDVPYGRRWNHYLQHGLVGVSKENVDNIVKMASLENQNSMNGNGSYGQNLRAQETKRRTLMNQWDKLLSDWNAGRYSGDEQSVQYFYNVANNLRNELTKEGVNPNTLRPPSLNAGGFAQGFQKNLQEDRKQLDWLGNWLGTIQKHVAEDPNWLNGGAGSAAQMYFDKLAEYTILGWAQSKGAIADAEKIRAQVEAMSPQDRTVFDRFMGEFFDASKIAQVEAAARAGSHSARATLDSLDELRTGMGEEGMNFIAKRKPDGSWEWNPKFERLGTLIYEGFQTVVRDHDNNPIDLSSQIASLKDAKDAYLEYVMQNANVDRAKIWQSAVDQFNIHAQNYNNKLEQLGMNWGGWGYRGPQVDPGLTDYLRRWQSTQPVSAVMQNAQLGKGNPPKPVFDKRGGIGGGGGSETTDVSKKTQKKSERNRRTK